jgi:spermidine synthase
MKKSPLATLDQPVVSELSGVRYLHFDSPWVQGAMQVTKPNRLVLAYTQQMMAWLLFLQPQTDAIIGQLGLGAGALTRFCLKHLPNQLVVVEWNPYVIRVCQQFFMLSNQPRFEVIQDDAGKWVQSIDNHHTCDILMVDLYDTQARGPVRDSYEFYKSCYAVLSPVGIMVVNLFGAHESFDRNVRNIESAFAGRLLFLPQIDEGNQIVLAFKGPPLEVSWADLCERAEQIEKQYQLPARKWVKSMVTRLVQGHLVLN